jgi:hypothetical protein
MDQQTDRTKEIAKVIGRGTLATVESVAICTVKSAIGLGLAALIGSHFGLVAVPNPKYIYQKAKGR